MKKDLIKTLIIFLLIGFIFYIFAVNKTAVEQDKDAVVFWTLQMGDFAPYMNQVIKDYEEKTGIKIQWIDVPFSEGEKRTLAAILSNNPPDLINLNPDFSALLAEKGALENIDEDILSQFLPNILNSLKYNDKIYSLPWYATSAITIYNKELLKEAGYKKVPQTYERVAKIAADVKQKTNAYIMMPTITENDTMLKILNKYNASSSDTINSESGQNVFEMFDKLYKSGLIPKESVTQTQREALEKYMSGQIVFFQSGANFLNMIKENAPAVYENTDVAKQFSGTAGQNDFSLMTLVIPLKSSKKEKALDFALYLTDKKNQLELAKLTNIIAVNKYALRDEYYTKYDEDDLLSKARCISAKQLNKIEPALKIQKGQKEVNLLINTAVQEILLNNKDIEQTLNEVSKKWKILNEE